jgi:hypothetical protein
VRPCFRPARARGRQHRKRRFAQRRLDGAHRVRVGPAVAARVEIDVLEVRRELVDGGGRELRRMRAPRVRPYDRLPVV